MYWFNKMICQLSSIDDESDDDEFIPAKPKTIKKRIAKQERK